MADDFSTVIDDAFGAFRHGGPIGVPVGADAVRTTVRRRRRARIITATALAALIITTPITAYATGFIDSKGPPTPGTGVTPSQAWSPTPTDAAPSTTASTPVAPDGRIEQGALGNATLTLPAWQSGSGPVQCTAGAVKFSGGGARPTNGPDIQITKVAFADVDADGALETLALLRCNQGEAPFQMVVGFDKDATGKIHTMGRVLSTTLATPLPADRVTQIRDLRAAGNAIELETGDYYPCCDTPQDLPQFQWRAYAWNGTAFTQTGGPVTFPPNPHVSNYKVTAGKLTLKPDGTGKVTGTVTVTIRNNGPTAPPNVALVSVPAMVALGPAPSGCADSPGSDPRYVCTIGTIPAGTSRTWTLQVVGTDAAAFPAGSTGTLHVYVFSGSHVSNASDTVYPDVDGTDNVADITYTVSA